VARDKEKVLIIAEKLNEKGKLTIHGSDRSHVRPNQDEKGHKAIVWGNKLMNYEKKEIGARHIFTIFPPKPNYIPTSSPALNRESDQIIQAKSLAPFILVFFAIPQKGVKVSLSLGINIDRLEKIPDDLLGYGLFPMRIHDILWCAYRTKGLVWPKVSQAFYTDGYDVPFVLGEEPGRYTLEVHQPVYSLVENKFSITINKIGDKLM